MERTPVSSSNVANIGYDEKSMTLEVEFNNGSVYQYYDVPQAIWEGLSTSSSKGQYLFQNIKGKFRYAKT